MTSEASFQRALLLQQHGRYDLAERELRQLVLAEPNEGMYRRMLAMVLSQQEKEGAALHEAREAVRLAPDDADSYYTLGHVHLVLGLHREAEAAALRTVELDPNDASHFALLAQVHLRRHRWREALEAAERGLELDAEHDGCTHARTQALTHLGRHEEAAASIADSLRRRPEDDVTHCDLGWSLLAQGKPEQAAGHFREALRIDPKYDYARQGLVESLKARHATWAAMLRFVLWASRWPSWLQWAFIIGIIVANRLLRLSLSDDPYLVAIHRVVSLMLGLGFVLMAASDSLFTLLLRWSGEKRVLTPEQRRAAEINTVLIIAAALLLSSWPFIGLLGAMLAAMVCMLLMSPVSRACEAVPGRPRQLVTAYVIAVAVVGALAAASRLPHAIVAVLDLFGPLPTLYLMMHGFKLLILFVIAAYLTDWVADRIEQRHRAEISSACSCI